MNKKSSNQLPLFESRAEWFHVFVEMIESGDAAKMGGTAFLIYSVIKSHVSFKSGVSFPSVEKITEKAGVSHDTVNRALKTLEDMQYISKHKVGRHNVYKLREKINIRNDDGENAAVATFDYIPDLVKTATTELRNFNLTGNDDQLKVIHIERLIMNIGNLNINSEVNAEQHAQFHGLPDSSPLKKAWLASQKAKKN